MRPGWRLRVIFYSLPLELERELYLEPELELELERELDLEPESELERVPNKISKIPAGIRAGSQSQLKHPNAKCSRN